MQGDLNILEIGEHGLFKQGRPDQTEFILAASDFEQWARPRFPEPAPRSVGELRRAVRAGAFDLIVLHAPAYSPLSCVRLRQYASSWRRGLRGTAARASLPFMIDPGPTPIVVLDMEDQPSIYRHNLRLLDRCTAYFKRELPTDHARLFLRLVAPALPTETERGDVAMQARIAKLHPISIGLPADRVPDFPADMAKEVDVFFAGQSTGNSTVRARGLDELAVLARHGVRIDIAAGRLSWPDYAARCARAHLVWSPEGLGWDCFRHYEAALCGSVPVISQPTIHRYRPLIEGIHCFHYGVEPGGLVRAVRAALRNPDRLRRMAVAGRRHVLRHHIHSRLCDYVVATSLRGTPA